MLSSRQANKSILSCVCARTHTHIHKQKHTQIKFLVLYLLKTQPNIVCDVEVLSVCPLVIAITYINIFTCTYTYIRTHHTYIQGIFNFHFVFIYCYSVPLVTCTYIDIISYRTLGMDRFPTSLRGVDRFPSSLHGVKRFPSSLPDVDRFPSSLHGVMDSLLVKTFSGHLVGCSLLTVVQGLQVQTKTILASNHQWHPKPPLCFQILLRQQCHLSVSTLVRFLRMPEMGRL